MAKWKMSKTGDLNVCMGLVVLGPFGPETYEKSIVLHACMHSCMHVYTYIHTYIHTFLFLFFPTKPYLHTYIPTDLQNYYFSQASGPNGPKTTIFHKVFGPTGPTDRPTGRPGRPRPAGPPCAARGPEPGEESAPSLGSRALLRAADVGAGGGGGLLGMYVMLCYVTTPGTN